MRKNYIREQCEPMDLIDSGVDTGRKEYKINVSGDNFRCLYPAVDQLKQLIADAKAGKIDSVDVDVAGECLGARVRAVTVFDMKHEVVSAEYAIGMLLGMEEAAETVGHNDNALYISQALREAGRQPLAVPV